VGAERVAEAESVAAPSGSDGFSDETMAALASLPPEQRALVVLRHLLEYTPGEIASMLDLPRGTVNSRLRRGLDGLQQALGERP
jgi:RNA polymerase sigma-70 factor (ECF subfamily)